MTKEILPIIAILIVIIAISTVNAESITSVGEEKSNAYHINKVNNNISIDSTEFKKIDFVDFSKSKNMKKHDVIIIGKVSNCNDSKPFEGAKILVKSLQGKKFATAISDSKGKYKTTFKSLDHIFIVEATYPGHVYPSEKVTAYGSKNIKYGKANFKLGELIVNKCHSDIIIFNKDGIYQNNHLIHVQIINNGTGNVTNAWANFSWRDNDESYYALAPDENSSQFIGNISSGEIVDVFFKIIFNKTTNSGNSPRREYEINIIGSNPSDGSRIDSENITGELQIYRTPVTNSMQIDNFQVNNSDPYVGEYITVTSNYRINNANGWFTPFISYDKTTLRLITIITTNQSGSNTSLSLINSSVLGGNSFITTWTFEVIGEGSSEIWGALFGRPMGIGEHYADFNENPININANKRIETDDNATAYVSEIDLAINKTVNNKHPNLGDIITYTITITNNGNNKATRVIVTDNLPDGLIFINSSNNANDNSYDHISGIWEIENLAPGETTTLYITVKINHTGNITNYANVTGNEQDTNLSNNNANTTIIVQVTTNKDIYSNDNTVVTKKAKEKEEIKDSVNVTKKAKEKEEIKDSVGVTKLENPQVPEKKINLPNIVLDEFKDQVEVIEDKHSNDTQTDVNNTIVSAYVPMKKTALPIAILMLLILNMFGLILTKDKKL